jgi:hypothetical protein
LEGRTEDERWTILDERRDGSELNRRRRSATFEIGIRMRVHILRLRQIGLNHQGIHFLAFSAFEIFGGFFRPTSLDWRLIRFRSVEREFGELRRELIDKGIVGECFCFDSTDRFDGIISRLTRDCGGNVADCGIIKQWTLEGRTEDERWTILDERRDDSQLNGPVQAATFELGIRMPVRILRLRQTGLNHRGNHCLGFSAFEIFGRLYRGALQQHYIINRKDSLLACRLRPLVCKRSHFLNNRRQEDCSAFRGHGTRQKSAAKPDIHQDEPFVCYRAAIALMKVQIPLNGEKKRSGISPACSRRQGMRVRSPGEDGIVRYARTIILTFFREFTERPDRMVVLGERDF